MPILFTEVFKDNVLDPLISLLHTEFTRVPVHHDVEFKPRGSFFLRMIPITDNIVEQTTEDQIRNYGIMIRFYRKTPGRVDREDNFRQLMNYTDRLKRLIGNNSNYSPSNTYKWHDGRISSISFQPDLDENEEQYQCADALFECTVLI